MNILNEELLKNTEQFDLFIEEISAFLELNSTIEIEYKNLLLAYINKIVDVPVENIEIESKKADTIVDFLNKLKENLSIIKQNILRIENLKKLFSTTRTSRY